MKLTWLVLALEVAICLYLTPRRACPYGRHHHDRVKKLVVEPMNPYVLVSCGEDGLGEPPLVLHVNSISAVALKLLPTSHTVLNSKVDMALMWRHWLVGHHRTF